MLEHNADWVTDYLTLPVAEGGMGIDQGLVVISFSVCSLTGPTLGVFFGGWIIDRQGGYKCDTGKAAMDTLQTCSYFGIGAVGCALPTAFGTNYWFIMTTMWFVLFFGGALLSPCTGVCINSVHPDLRSFSSALSMFAYNILGYAAAPFACGVVGERFGLAWGFRMALLSSTVCLLGLFGACYVSRAVYFAGAAGSGDVEQREHNNMSIDFANPCSGSRDGGGGGGGGGGGKTTSLPAVTDGRNKKLSRSGDAEMSSSLMASSRDLTA